MDRKILVGAVAAIAVIAGLGYTFLGDRAPVETPAPESEATGAAGQLDAAQVKALGIRLEQAKSVSHIPLASVPATVSLPPEARVAVAAPFPGIATRVLVIEGEQVRQGQPLATLRAADPVQFGADLSRARADLAVDKARAERLETLAREGVIAGARADEARATLRRTEASVSENRRLLALAGASSDGTGTLRAPISGRIARVSIEAGSPLGTDTAPFLVENTSALTLDLQLPERLAGVARPGMSVTVALPGSSQPVTGKLASVGASLDPATRSIAARARLSGASMLVPGQSVTAVIAAPSGSGRAGVSVPDTALTRIDEKDTVFVRQGSGNAARFVPRTVTVVGQASGRSILSDGISAGDAVVVSGVAELKSALGGA